MKNESISQKISYISRYSNSLCLILVIGIMICFATDCMGQREFDHLTYEDPGVLIASDVLPPELKWGNNYSVRGVTDTTVDTTTQGFTHRFEITSTYGNFEAHSVDMVRIRVHEINVISVLQDIKKTQAFSKAIKKAGKGPYKDAVDLIVHPVDTVTGLPYGRWRLLSQSGEMIQGGTEGRDGGPDDALFNFLKLKRQYAYKLGVDVYSSNKALQKELNSVSLAGFASEAGTSLLITKAGKSAEGLVLKDAEGLLIKRTPFSDKIDKLLLDNTQEDLQLLNREKLMEIGVEDPVIDTFLNHPKYSSRNRTIMVHALAYMEGVKSRNKLIKQAVSAEHEDFAFYYQQMAEMIQHYHNNVKPITELIPVRKSVAGYTTEKDIVATLPIDNLYWTEITDQFVTELLELSESEDLSVKQVIIWIPGKATSHAKEVLKARGIVIKENM